MTANVADAVPVRPSSAKWIFAQSGGQNHENGFLQMSTSARYATTGLANFAFYFNEYDASDFRFIGDPWNYVNLHGNLRNGTSCGINAQNGSFGAFGRNGSSDFYIGYRNNRTPSGPIISALAAANSVGEFGLGDADTASQCGNGETSEVTPQPLDIRPAEVQRPRRAALLTQEPAAQPQAPQRVVEQAGEPSAPVERSVRLVRAEPIIVALSSGPQRIHALTFAASGFAPDVNAH